MGVTGTMSPLTSTLPAMMEHKKRGFVMSHLLGHCSLGRSFWLHKVGLSCCLYFAYFWLSQQDLGQRLLRLDLPRTVHYWLGLALMGVVMWVVVFELWANMGVIASAFRRIQAGDGWFLSLIAMGIAVGSLYEFRIQMSEQFAEFKESPQIFRNSAPEPQSWQPDT